MMVYCTEAACILIPSNIVPETDGWRSGFADVNQVGEWMSGRISEEPAEKKALGCIVELN